MRRIQKWNMNSSVVWVSMCIYFGSPANKHERGTILFLSSAASRGLFFSQLRPLFHCSFDSRAQLFYRAGISGHRVALSVVEQDGRILVAHAVERHGAVNIGVVAADDVASRNVNQVFALVGKEALDGVVLDLDRRPTGKEYTELGRERWLACAHRN